MLKFSNSSELILSLIELAELYIQRCIYLDNYSVITKIFLKNNNIKKNNDRHFLNFKGVKEYRKYFIVLHKFFKHSLC